MQPRVRAKASRAAHGPGRFISAQPRPDWTALRVPAEMLARAFAPDMVARQIKQFEWRFVAGATAMPQVFAQTWLDVVAIGERDEFQQLDHAGRGDSGDGLQHVEIPRIEI